MDRIDFENSNRVERSERIREVDRARGDRRKEGSEKRKNRRKRGRKQGDPEAEEKTARQKVGVNLDIEA